MAEPIAAFESHAFFNMDVGKKFVIIWKKSCNVQKIQRFVHVMQDFLQNGGLSMIQYDSEIELEYFPFAFFARKNRNEVGSRKTQFLYGCFESINKISNASELSITSSRSFQRQEIESI